MHSPLKSALEFVSLNRKKDRLSDRMQSVSQTVQRHLLPSLVEVELERAARSTPRTQVSESQLQAAFARLLTLKKGSQPEPRLLAEIQQQVTAGGSPDYRRHPVPARLANHEPVDARIIPRALERFFEWARSPAFGEMHPVEQMSIAQARLYEIYPFAQACESGIGIFSHAFLLAGGFLPASYAPHELPDFYRALGQAFIFTTQPLVQLNLRACERAFDRVLG